MAVINNTLKTYEVIGNREQLADTISNIAPTETPFYSNASKGTAQAVFADWQVDTLQAPDGANAQLEGDDVAAYDQSFEPTRIGNYCQISRKTAIISDTAEVIEKAGRKSEMAYQLAKKGMELKRDIETILLSNQAAAAGAAGVARKTGSLLAFVKTNTDIGATGVNPVYTNVPNVARTDGTLRAAAESQLKTVLQSCWQNGAEVTTVMLGGLQKQAYSAFAGIATKTFNQSAAKAFTVIGAVDIYVSDFGTVTFVPNRFQRNKDAHVLDFDFVQIDFLAGRKFKQVPLAKTGDAEKRMIIAEYMLRIKNEKALGLVADLS